MDKLLNALRVKRIRRNFSVNAAWMRCAFYWITCLLAQIVQKICTAFNTACTGCAARHAQAHPQNGRISADGRCLAYLHWTSSYSARSNAGKLMQLGGTRDFFIHDVLNALNAIEQVMFFYSELHTSFLPDRLRFSERLPRAWEESAANLTKQDSFSYLRSSSNYFFNKRILFF